MRWGLPPAPGSAHPNEPLETAIWHRDIWNRDPDLLKPASRCLIILDSFAHADGPEGNRTRTWYGYDDMPIFAWAGVWRRSGRKTGFAGILVPGTDPVTSRAMPAIVPPEHYSTWLQAEVGTPGWNMWRDQGRTLYREPTEQPWGRGRTIRGTDVTAWQKLRQ
jgi:putative SOS response-associated peptidase YedK